MFLWLRILVSLKILLISKILLRLKTLLILRIRLSTIWYNSTNMFRLVQILWCDLIRFLSMSRLVLKWILDEITKNGSNLSKWQKVHHMTKSYSLDRCEQVERSKSWILKKLRPPSIQLLKWYDKSGLSFFDFQLFYQQKFPGKKIECGLAAVI